MAKKKRKSPEKRQGNDTKADLTKKISPLYESNMVTLSNRKENETPLVDDENVEYARRFVEENKK